MALRAFIKKNIATKGVQKWFFKKAGYYQYGLFRDDCFYETPEVQEAIRRMPQDIQDKRVYRIQRAMQLCVQHDILPKQQWTTFDDCLNNRYLEPYLNEVEKEKKERNQWEKAH